MRTTLTPRGRRSELACRWQVAGEWQHLLEIAQSGPIASRWRVPPRRRTVEAAQPQIERLIDTLYSLEPVDTAGLTLARRLVRDGAGPVYDPRARRSLTEALEDCINALEPSRGSEMTYGSSGHAHARRRADGRRRPRSEAA